MADFPPNTDPNRPALCPRQLIGEGPRCRALVLVADAPEHEAFHDRLDELLTAPVEYEPTVDVAAWPAPVEHTTAAPAL